MLTSENGKQIFNQNVGTHLTLTSGLLHPTWQSYAFSCPWSDPICFSNFFQFVCSMYNPNVLPTSRVLLAPLGFSMYNQSIQMLHIQLECSMYNQDAPISRICQSLDISWPGSFCINLPDLALLILYVRVLVCKGHTHKPPHTGPPPPHN